MFIAVVAIIGWVLFIGTAFALWKVATASARQTNALALLCATFLLSKDAIQIGLMAIDRAYEANVDEPNVNTVVLAALEELITVAQATNTENYLTARREMTKYIANKGDLLNY